MDMIPSDDDWHFNSSRQVFAMLQRMLAIRIDDRHRGSYPRFAQLREP
jgi:hypothetical protein